jgi:ABC-2 type transport system permease protein
MPSALSNTTGPVRPATGEVGGTVKLLLYTLVPAAFVTYLPIVALRDLSLVDAALAAAGSFGFLLLSAAVFYAGLRRYESGNLLAMRE